MTPVILTRSDGVPIYVNPDQVEAIEPLLTNLPPAVLVATTLRLAGFEVLTVLGSAAFNAALLAGVPPGPTFGDNFQQAAAAGFTTPSAALVAVTGTEITIAAGAGGSRIFFPSAGLSVDNVLEGLQCTLLKNGVPLGQSLIRPAGSFGFANQPIEEFAQHMIDVAAPGDVYAVGLAAIPGGGPNLARADGARLACWQVG